MGREPLAEDVEVKRVLDMTLSKKETEWVWILQCTFLQPCGTAGFHLSFQVQPNLPLRLHGRVS